MSISTYEVDGKTFYKIYVNIRSRVLPRIRRQKVLLHDRNGNRIENHHSALAEEKKLIRALAEEVSTLEGKGLTWGEIVNRWESYQFADPQGRYNKMTIVDHAQMMRNWTTSWLNRPVKEISRGDARAVFREAHAKGRSFKFQKALKNTINVIFKWAMEEGLTEGISQTPVTGLDVEGSKEEKKPEILTKEQVRKLLREAQFHNHPWYPIWVMAVQTGCRSGELIGMRAEDCSFVSKEQALVQDKLPPEKRNYGFISIQRSWNKRESAYTCTKAKYWRNVPVSGELFWFIQNLLSQDFGRDEFGKYLLPHMSDWKLGLQAQVLRTFCEEIKIPSIRFHTLRACFATHLLELGVPSIKVMKAGGWKDLKTMERYTRLAGIDIVGITEGLEIIPGDSGLMENVVNIYQFRAPRREP